VSLSSFVAVAPGKKQMRGGVKKKLPFFILSARAGCLER
jgi:hypothetical protein